MSWTNLDYELCLLMAPHPGQGPLNAREYCDARRWISQSPLSVGTRADPIQQSRISFPSLLPTTFPSSPAANTQKTAGGSQSLIQESLQVAVPADFVSWHNPAKGEYIARVNGTLVKKTTTPQSQVVTNAPVVQQEDSIMDLGNILGTVQQVANIVNTVRSGGQTQFVSNNMPNWQQAMESGPSAGTPDYVPFVDVIPQQPANGCGGKPVYKYSCGAYKWVFPKKRRRKALVTKQDIAGLAQLKGVVGVGKTMDTWIATHS